MTASYQLEPDPLLYTPDPVFRLLLLVAPEFPLSLSPDPVFLLSLPNTSNLKIVLNPLFHSFLRNLAAKLDLSKRSDYFCSIMNGFLVRHIWPGLEMDQIC